MDQVYIYYMRPKGTSPKLVFAGHVDGHVNILARTSSDGTWILLGAVQLITLI
jgi:hypothetical protein